MEKAKNELIKKGALAIIKINDNKVRQAEGKLVDTAKCNDTVKKMSNIVKSVSKSGNIPQILDLERHIINGEIKYAKEVNIYERGRDTSLNAALQGVDKALNTFNQVTDKDKYKAVHELMSDNKIDRVKGLPKDAVHRFIDSQSSRIMTSIKSFSGTKQEQQLLVNRSASLSVARKGYMELQAASLGINISEKHIEKDR